MLKKKKKKNIEKEQGKTKHENRIKLVYRLILVSGG